MYIILATLLGLVVGVSGNLAGGLMVLYQRKNSATQQGWLLGFSGGIMMAVTVFDLWPEAWHFGGLWPVLIGTTTGIILVNYFDPILQQIPWYREHRLSKITRVGILLGMGIGTHNFPEGVALGTTFITNPISMDWLGLALLMAIHNIPEGMVLSSALKLGKVRLFKIIMALMLVEIPMAFGSTIGAFLGQISGWMIALSLSFAAGAMFLLVVKELLPLARKLSSIFWVGLGFGVGTLVGIIIVNLLH